jgi:hypothetical protein
MSTVTGPLVAGPVTGFADSKPTPVPALRAKPPGKLVVVE